MVLRDPTFYTFVLGGLVGSLLAYLVTGWNRLLVFALMIPIVELTWFAKQFGMSWFEKFSHPAWMMLIAFSVLAATYAYSDHLEAQDAKRLLEKAKEE